MKVSNIFFCGSVLTHEALNKYRGEAPSASQWIYGFLKGLQENGITIKTFSPVWDATFPKGFLYPGSLSDLCPEFPSEIIKYINIKGVRDTHITTVLYNKIVKEIKEGNIPDVIITYNLYPRYTQALIKIKKEYSNIKWIPLILDADDPRLDNWNYILDKTKVADGCVFLSWWGYENAPIKNKFHLDSGWIGNYPKTIENREKIFVYAGKMIDDGSFTGLIKAIKLVKNEDARFDFYGKGLNKDLLQLAREDKRVRIQGFVTDDVLNIACQNAIAFLSPRDDTNQENIMIFPSKILVYLQYRKPIISPRLPGISPEYNQVLEVLEGNTPEEWSDKMNAIIQYTDEEINEVQLQSTKILENKRWRKQTNNLINFIKSIDDNNPKKE